jgi:hypothetical protein
VTLTKEDLDFIKTSATKEAKGIELKHQEAFVALKVETEVLLNETINTAVDAFKSELAQYLSSEASLGTMAVHLLLMEGENKIREVLKTAMSQTNSVHNAVMKVLIFEGVKKGLDACLKCQVEQEVKLKALAGGKEN